VITGLGVGRPDIASGATKMLLLNPVRAIFTDRQRAVNVHVINSSDENITYTIALVTMRKDQKGNLYEPETETEQEKLIKSMIRFSPRRATIEPGKRQVLKLMVRKPKDLPTGEYQTHIRLSPDPKQVASNRKSQENLSQEILKLDIIVNSAFPIIIQHGDNQSDVNPIALSLTEFPQAPAGIAANVSFTRKGEFSTFGDVFLYYIPSDNPKNKKKIGTALGMAVYIPETTRTLTVPLSDITQQELANGTIRVSYNPNRGVVERRKKRRQMKSKDFPLPL
jgi:hypothetical protein